MVGINAQWWTNQRGKRYVLLTEADFLRLSELLEDAGLSRLLRQAKQDDPGGPGTPWAHVKRQLSAAWRAKPTGARKRPSTGPAKARSNGGHRRSERATPARRS